MRVNAHAIVRVIKRYAVVVLGLALFCALLRQPYFGNVISAQLPNAHFVRAILDGLILVCAIIATIVGARAGNRRPPRSMPLVCMALFTFGIGIFAATRSFELDGLSTYVGSALCAVGLMILAFSWMQILSYIPRDDLVPIAMTAFTASLLVGTADVAEGLVKDFINVLIPIGSACCAIIAARATLKSSEKDGLGDSPHVLLIVVTALVVEVLCCSLVRGTWNGGGIGYAGMSSYRLFSYLISAVIGIVFFVIAALAKRPERCGAIIGIVSLAGVIILIVALVVYGRSITPSFVTSLYSALLIVLFAVLASAVHSGFLSPLTAAGVFCAVFGAVSFISYTAIPVLADYDRTSSSHFLLPAALAAALIIVVGEFAVMIIQFRVRLKALKSTLGDASREDLWNSIASRPEIPLNPPPPPNEDPLGASVAKAAKVYSLTAREADIVKLFAQGRTIKRTAEELFLAPSTVQGYTKSIYAKMGIHGKDEIKDLLDDLED